MNTVGRASAPRRATKAAGCDMVTRDLIQAILGEDWARLAETIFETIIRRASWVAPRMRFRCPLSSLLSVMVNISRDLMERSEKISPRLSIICDTRKLAKDGLLDAVKGVNGL